MSNYDPRIIALAQHLGYEVPETEYTSPIDEDGNERDLDFSEFESIEDIYYLENGYHAEGYDYLVLTDFEADQAADEYLDEMVEELINEITHKLDSGSAREVNLYFDRDSWKRDELLNAGRGFLASNDGNESEVFVDGDLFYVYNMG